MPGVYFLSVPLSFKKVIASWSSLHRYLWSPFLEKALLMYFSQLQNMCFSIMATVVRLCRRCQRLSFQENIWGACLSTPTLKAQQQHRGTFVSALKFPDSELWRHIYKSEPLKPCRYILSYCTVIREVHSKFIPCTM